MAGAGALSSRLLGEYDRSATLYRLLPILGALLLFVVAPAQAAVFNVANTNDSGPGSLRQAILSSNANGEGDTINVPGGFYTLTSGELPVAGEGLTIDGAGAGATVIHATGAFRVFRIANSSDPVELFDLTISGGNVAGNGGGILNQAGSGPLTLEDSVVEGNRATTSGATANGGGGGIYNDGGQLTVQRSTIRANTTSATGSGGSNGGGGIYETGSSGALIEDSTLSENNATVSGAGSGGGGLWSQPAAVLRNSTLSGNVAGTSGPALGGGGAYYTPTGGGTITHVTVAGNSAGLPGGGLFNGGGTAVPLRNTIVAGNSGAGGSNCSGAFNSLGNNLESADTCNLTDPDDKRSTDPSLGPLADNGGPTPTRQLQPGSPAIDAADAGHCGVVPQDQRGASRTSNGCDIGAYEFDGLTVAQVPDCSPTGQIPLTMTAAPGEGVDSFHYRIDGGPELVVDTPGGSVASTTITIPEGRRRLEYWGQYSNGVQLGHRLPEVLVDQTRPTVSVQSEQRQSIYVIRRRATVNVSANDALSGLVANPSGSGQPISTASRGRKTVAKTAEDLCGNQATAALDYNVLGPGLGVRAVLEPLGRGTVRVRLPATGSARASQKGSGYVAVREPREIPVGSLLDTRRGRIRLTSSATTATRIQDGEFLGGVFQVLQSRRRAARGLTELRLRGSSFRRCGSAASAAARRLSRRTVRRITSRANGRFRTRGRFSAATVRGTTWTTSDRCDGTLTKVTRGSVTVRDFRRRKNIVVRRGKSYLARAPR